MALTLDKARKGLAATASATANGDSEIKAMLAQVDMLSIAQQDTGEQGSSSGKWVYFRGECPICHHKDCFRIVPETNSWECEGASNTTGYRGGTYLEYVKATGRAANDSEAVAMLRELTGNPRTKPEQGHESAADGPASDLPPIVGVRAQNPPKRAPELVHGLLRTGHKLYVSSASKAGKTFLGIELAICVATGRPWLSGDWRCKQRRVLYVDFELDPRSFDNRVHAVAEAMGAPWGEVEANIRAWHLRGHAMGTAETAQALCSMVAQGDYSLIILDPIYKMMDGDENSAHDVRAFWNEIDRIGGSTGASVMCVHHHSKGAKGDAAAIDRGSGSGVFARDPDAVIDLVEVFPPEDADNLLAPQAHAFQVTCGGLREFPSFAPFYTVFDYPVHRPGAELGVNGEWKPRTAQRKGGKKSGATREEKAEAELRMCEAVILKTFEERGVDRLTVKEAAELTGVANGTLKKRIAEGGSEVLAYESHGQGKAAYIVRAFIPKPVQMAAEE